MRLAHIRIENTVTYIKEPYACLLPESAVASNQIAPKDYTAFDKLTILFKGFGKTTVISFKDEKSIKKLEIPNDLIIVENR